VSVSVSICFLLLSPLFQWSVGARRGRRLWSRSDADLPQVLSGTFGVVVPSRGSQSSAPVRSFGTRFPWLCEGVGQFLRRSRLPGRSSVTSASVSGPTRRRRPSAVGQMLPESRRPGCTLRRGHLRPGRHTKTSSGLLIRPAAIAEGQILLRFSRR